LGSIRSDLVLMPPKCMVMGKFEYGTSIVIYSHPRTKIYIVGYVWKEITAFFESAPQSSR